MNVIEAPLRTLLVATDGSPRCEPAILAGLALARRLDAALEVIHAVAVPADPTGGVDSRTLAASRAEALGAARERVSSSLRALLERAGRGDPGGESLLQVLPGNPAQALLERAEARSADLVILGPHQGRGLLDFGSTARALLSRAPCAVWVQPGEFREPRRILAPVDMSYESLLALAHARTLAARLDASIETLHCFQPPEFTPAQGLGPPGSDLADLLRQLRDGSRREYERAMAGFEWRGVEHAHAFVEGEPVSSILSRQGSVDLIAMGTHGRTGLSASVLGNVAYGVLRESSIPVLAFRHPDREWLA